MIVVISGGTKMWNQQKRKEKAEIGTERYRPQTKERAEMGNVRHRPQRKEWRWVMYDADHKGKSGDG